MNLTVEQGEFFPLWDLRVAVNILNIMGLLDVPTNGQIEINGIRTEGMGDKALASFRKKPGIWCSSSTSLISAIDNVEPPLLYRHMSAADRRKRHKRYLEKVGLSWPHAAFPHSYRADSVNVAIARAIVNSPEIISPMSLPETSTLRWDMRWCSCFISWIKKMAKPLSWLPTMKNKPGKTSRTVRFFDGRQVSVIQSSKQNQYDQTIYSTSHLPAAGTTGIIGHIYWAMHRPSV